MINMEKYVGWKSPSSDLFSIMNYCNVSTSEVDNESIVFWVSYLKQKECSIASYIDCYKALSRAIKDQNNLFCSDKLLHF